MKRKTVSKETVFFIINTSTPLSATLLVLNV